MSNKPNEGEDNNLKSLKSKRDIYSLVCGMSLLLAGMNGLLIYDHMTRKPTSSFEAAKREVLLVAETAVAVWSKLENRRARQELKRLASQGPAPR